MEGPDPDLAAQHHGHGDLQGGVLMAPKAGGLLKGLSVTFKELTEDRHQGCGRPCSTRTRRKRPHPRAASSRSRRKLHGLHAVCAQLPRLVHLHRRAQGEGAAASCRRQAPHGEQARPLRHRLHALHVLRHLRRGLPVRRALLESRVRVLRAPHRRPPPRQGAPRRVDGDGSRSPPLEAGAEAKKK